MTILRTISALLLTVSLAACGGQYDIDTSVQTAAATTVGSAAPETIAVPAAAEPAPLAANTGAARITVASATMPAPDCAVEGCASLRIIDGNAEAWRIDAGRRAALEASLTQT